jgi:hypothetical protein
MPNFLVLIHEAEATSATLAPRETQALLERQASYEQQLRQVGAYVDGERLRPSSEGRRVRRREDGPRVEAGPFDDPTLEAYLVLEATDLDAALALAEPWPVAPGAIVEVRPVMKGRVEADKTSRQGRVFAFAVLGAAPNERSWIEMMDRIDERTESHFPEDSFRGGVRLEAPSRGRQVSSVFGRRATFDGPFLESKEVIGGVFFMHLANLEEAVEWAKGSAFVDHGTLEIRELWRS